MSSVLMPFFLLSILNTSLIVLFSLFAYTPIPFGGLSRNVSNIMDYPNSRLILDAVLSLKKSDLLSHLQD